MGGTLRRGGRGGLTLGPRFVYPLKGAATRLRSTAWSARGRVHAADGLRVLFYHRISDDRDELAVTPKSFAEQMEVLAAARLQGVDVATAVNMLIAGELDPRIVALSFDDGYRDVAVEALPILERHRFTATVFLATAVTDGRVRLYWYNDQPPLLTWDEVRVLDGGTLRFECHTVTHPNLLLLDEAGARAEIVDGKRELEARLGRESQIFCYPAGLFRERECRLVREAGFRAATSCEPGLNGLGSDLFELRRTQIDARDSLLDFRAKVAGAHDAPLPFRGLWRRFRYGADVGRPRAAGRA